LEALKLLPGAEEADTERRPKRRSGAALALVLALVVGAALALFFALGNDPSPDAQTSAQELPARGRLVIRAIDASALGAQRQWQGPALQRRLVNELWDGWEIAAQVGEGEALANSASGTGFSGVLTQNEAGQLELRLAWAHAPRGAPLLASGTSFQSLAVAAAKAIVEATTEASERAPSQASMARVGAKDPEAWRLWRRAQRASLMQQWSLSRLLAGQASKLDPDFPLPYFEESWSYGGNDEIRIAPLKRALQTMLKHSEISSNWKVVADMQRVRLAGDSAAEALLFEKLSKQPMTPGEAYYFNARVLMAKYFDGKPEQTLPAIKYMAEQNAQRADQVKLLANAYLKLQSKQSAQDAVNNARKALTLAPEDVAVRADFVRALLHVGEEEEARRQASWVDSADAQDKLYANSGGERTNSILDMHMALGDAGGARGDVLRMEAGSEIQRGQALHMQAIIDAYEGNEASALDRLQKAMQVFGEVGITEFVTIGRYERALTYFELGNSQAAVTVLAELPHIPLSAADKMLKLRAQAKLSKQPALLIAEAREILAGARFDPSQRALMEMALASDLGEYQEVVDFAARQQGNNGRIAWLYYAGDAHENLGNYEEAELLFRELGNHYNGYTEPRLSARAWLRVAALRERVRDKSGAGEAYARFLARYSRAPRTDPEVRRARKRSAKH
jgi:tetratricopeptide (TPR) repeat protein